MWDFTTFESSNAVYYFHLFKTFILVMKIKLILALFLSALSYAQVANTPPTLAFCDDNYDGLLAFDLTVQNSVILGSQSPSDYTLSYHETMADADNNINELYPSFYIVHSSRTIYARVTEKATDNYDTTSFELVVYPLPTINEPSAYEVCDDNNDGIETFDLSSKTNEIIGSEIDVEVSYYLTNSDAETQVNQLSTTYNSDTQTVYVRVQKIGSGCYVIVQLDLIAQDCRDEDSDGVINGEEDINGNGNLDDDDTDGDGIPDYLDDDDDGDNIDTADELVDQSSISGKYSSLKKSNSVIDTDNDIIPNYIDDDDDGDGVLTKDEDYNNNGTPLDDDTNNNSVPDYLESSVALSVSVFLNHSFSICPNPTNDIIYLLSKKGVSIKKIEVYSISGKLLFENNKITNMVDLKNFPKGMYFLNIVSDKGSVPKKIIKK
ncbi:hypothetical protein GCM10022395_30650 [Snuella lapsa]|uniref:Secretion system C-terminal sorting domain-containing protein n=2 Tax=Snuella lapsa TaxID=870481 RepID=A0ABP6YDE1_9FLAO